MRRNRFELQQCAPKTCGSTVLGARSLSVDCLDRSNFSCCMKSSSQHLLVKCVKCESSSLEIAQQIAAARPFPHDIPRISKSEDLSSKMSIMAFHGTYGTSIIQSTKLPMENVFFALRLQFGGSWWIIGHHMIQIYSNIFQ